MSARDEILSTIRRSLGVTGREAPRRETVEDRLAEITDNEELRYVLTYLWGKYGLPPQVASWAAHCLVAGQFFEGASFPKGGAGSIENSSRRRLRSCASGPQKPPSTKLLPGSRWR